MQRVARAKNDIVKCWGYENANRPQPCCGMICRQLNVVCRIVVYFKLSWTPKSNPSTTRSESFKLHHCTTDGIQQLSITSRHGSCSWSQDGWHPEEGVAEPLPPNRQNREAVSLLPVPLGEERPYVGARVLVAHCLHRSLDPIYSVTRKPSNA